MYRIRYKEKDMKRYEINERSFKAVNLFELLLDNLRYVIIQTFGVEAEKYFFQEIETGLLYEIKLNTSTNDNSLNIKIKQGEEVLECGEIEIKFLDSVEVVNETICIELEKFYGVKEMAAFVGLERRKFSTYLDRGKIIKPDYQLNNGPIWAESRIKNKLLFEEKRGKKNEDF